MLEKHKSLASGSKEVLYRTNRENLYETKNCKSFKYFLMQTLVTFCILCLLINITCEAYLNIKSNYLKAQENSGKLKQPISTMEPKEFEDNLEKTDSLANIVGPATCTSTQSNCTLYCRDGNFGYIDESLRKIKNLCPSTDFSLKVQNCEFYNGILSFSTFFMYDYTYVYFAITDSNLQTIEKSAFKHNSAKNIQVLILRNNLLTTLSATTFEGLGSLKYFKFEQQPLKGTFKGDGFLKPMANRLEEAFITQMTDGQEIQNPQNWLQNSELTVLSTLDMSNNNFQDILSSTSFLTLTAIENLILANCSLLTVTNEIFTSIENTLKYLDLSQNNLQTFDLAFFELVALRNIKLEISNNEWYCDCENTDFIKFFFSNIELTDGVICSEPEKWQNIELKQVIAECREYITTTIEISSTQTTEIATITTPQITNPPTTTTEISTTTPKKSSMTTSEISEDTTTPDSNEISSTTKTVASSEDSTESTITTEISITTTRSPNYIPIICHSSSKTETTLWFYHITFIISTISASSVAIKIPDFLQKFDILCFTNYPNYMNLSQLHYTISNNIVFIQKLVSRTTYIFCLTTDSQITVSPLQCQAHFVGVTSQMWLSAKDQIWCIPVLVIICLIIIVSAVIAVYFILHKHPYWLLNENEEILKDSKRKNSIEPKEMESSHYLRAHKPSDQDIYSSENNKSLYSSNDLVPDARAPILPPSKKYKKSSCPSYVAAQKDIYSAENSTSLYSSNDLVPDVRAPILPPGTKYRKSSCPSYVAVQKCDIASKYSDVLFNRFQSSNDKNSSLYVSQHKAPDVKAPNLPAYRSDNILQSKEIRSIQLEDDDPDYQIIDHYEVVPF